LKKTDREVVVLDGKGDIDINDFERYGDLIVVVGSEGHGVTREMKHLAEYRVKIDYRSDFDSLNVSVATGIGLYLLQKA